MKKQRKIKKVIKVKKIVRKHKKQETSPLHEIVTEYMNPSFSKYIHYQPKNMKCEQNDFIIILHNIESSKFHEKQILKKFPQLRKNTQYRDYLKNVDSHNNPSFYSYENNNHLWIGKYVRDELDDYPLKTLENQVNEIANIIENHQKMINRLVFYIDDLMDLQFMMIQLLQKFYTFSYFKSKQKSKVENNILPIIITHLSKKSNNRIIAKKIHHILNNVIIITRGLYLGRNLENMPSNLLYPEKFAEVVKMIIHKLPAKIRKNIRAKYIYSRDLKKRGFNTIVAVGQGSVHPPVLIDIEWYGIKAKKNISPTVLIGKGITFDSGGINLKRGDFSDMKMDKTGACVALSVFLNNALLLTKNNIRSLLALAENMPGENATRPGDVITSYSGKTIEITNTDAEGRLVIADALAYAQESKNQPQLIIDIATLTGQAERLTGGKAAVYMGNMASREWRGIIDRVKRQTTERIFELPLWDEWKNHLYSSIADIKNTSYDTDADILYAAQFLNYFVEENIPWIHIDLANNYPEKIKNNDDHYNSARGSSIYLLTELLQNNYMNSHNMYFNK
jgi:leucyl aminopeptidase